MELGIGSLIFALGAGALSTLSPCVIPILPIIVGSALNQHRFGPISLALGLAISFTILGTLLASFGVILGIDAHSFRNIAAILMTTIGIILLSNKLQEKFALATNNFSNSGNNLLSKVSIGGNFGQFIIGLLLGIVWAPCVGPTLGAAVTLASQGKDLIIVSIVMASFGIGAGIPLAILGFISRKGFMGIRGQLGNAAKIGKSIMGAVFLVVGLLILTGADKILEAFLLGHAPGWLINLTTYF